MKYFREMEFFLWIHQKHQILQIPIKLKDPQQKLAAKLQTFPGMGSICYAPEFRLVIGIPYQGY